MEANNLPTLASIRNIIRDEAAAGTGADIITKLEGAKPPVLQIGFGDLGWKRGPRIEVTPHGMRSYRIFLSFGSFCRPVFDRMNAADNESHELAISLIETAGEDLLTLEFPTPINRRWEIGPQFKVAAVTARLSFADPEERIRRLSRDIVVPLMSALAELNGYDILEGGEAAEAGLEGSLTIALVKRRERNPRNRLLALKIHGQRCKVCELDHSGQFGFDTPIIDIHHCQPLAQNEGSREYDPKNDLVPLCPTCHRAAHKRRPIPYSVSELRSMLADNQLVDYEQNDRT